MLVRYLILFLSLSLFTLNCKAQEQTKSIVDVLFETVETSGVDAAIQKYHDLKKTKLDEYKFDAGELTTLSRKLMAEEHLQDALVFSKLNVELFPENYRAHSNLGQCYLNMTDNALAIQSYNIALDLATKFETNERRKKFFTQNFKAKIYQTENFSPRTEKTFNYIVFFGGMPAGLWDMKNLANFKSENQGHRLSYDLNNLYSNPVPIEVPGKFETKFMGDVTGTFIGGVYREHIEKGEIADISELWIEENWDKQFPENFKRMVTYEGKQYIVPQAFQFNPIWYRKDIFEKHGWQTPKTWDELLALCDKIHAAGYSPFTVAASDWPPPVARWFTILNLRLNGPEFHEQVMQGDIPYTDNRIRQVFNHWSQLFEHNAFHDSTGWNTYGQGIRDIATGKAIMYNLGEWIFESLQDSTAQVMDFFPVPVINPKVTSAEIVHAYGSFLHTKAKNQAKAKDLIRYLGSVESQTSNVKQLKRINANMGIDQNLYTDVQKRLFEKVKETEVLVPLFEFNTEAKLAQAGLEAFVAFWRKPENVEQVLKDWEAKRVQLMTAK